MKLHLFAMALGVSAMIVAAGCSSEEGDATGGAGGGDGGSGNTGNEGGAGNSGNEGGAGNSGNEGGAGNAGGGGDCTSCAAFITDCAGGNPPPECEDPVFCMGSEDILDALLECVCTDCAADCELSCTGMGMDTADCGTCQMTSATSTCSTEFGECSNDAG